MELALWEMVVDLSLPWEEGLSPVWSHLEPSILNQYPHLPPWALWGLS